MTKKKILFSARIIDTNNHLFYKFTNQINALINIGFDVYYIVFSENNVLLKMNDVTLKEISSLEFISTKFKKILAYRLINRVARRIINEFNIDIIYHRNVIPFFGLNKTFQIASKFKVKIIVEIPTYPHKIEYKHDVRFFRKPLYPIIELMNKRNSRYVSLFALIGNQANECYGRPAINIDNGISVTRIPIREKNVNQNNEIHLISVATISNWHGFDRLIKGMSEYYMTTNSIIVYYHVIGPEGDGTLKKLKELVLDLKLEEYVVFHGPKFGVELDTYMNKSDLAIGSLANHRKGLMGGINLKIAEYCARGIPFIWTQNQGKLGGNIPFNYSQFPDDESIINIYEIINIVDNIRKINNYSELMRKYAIENLTWEKQFKKLFNGLSQE